MKKLIILAFLTVYFTISAQDQSPSVNQKSKKPEIVRENVKAFLEHDLDKYVVYDLMSDGTKVFKDTLDFNEYRDKAIFTITQNQTILNRQLWATLILLVVVVGLLIFKIQKNWAENRRGHSAVKQPTFSKFEMSNIRH